MYHLTSQIEFYAELKGSITIEDTVQMFVLFERLKGYAVSRNDFRYDTFDHSITALSLVCPLRGDPESSKGTGCPFLLRFKLNPSAALTLEYHSATHNHEPPAINSDGELQINISKKDICPRTLSRVNILLARGKELNDAIAQAVFDTLWEKFKHVGSNIGIEMLKVSRLSTIYLQKARHLCLITCLSQEKLYYVTPFIRAEVKAMLKRREQASKDWDEAPPALAIEDPEHLPE